MVETPANTKDQNHAGMKSFNLFQKGNIQLSY